MMTVDAQTRKRTDAPTYGGMCKNNPKGRRQHHGNTTHHDRPRRRLRQSLHAPGGPTCSDRGTTGRHRILHQQRGLQPSAEAGGAFPSQAPDRVDRAPANLRRLRARRPRALGRDLSAQLRRPRPWRDRPGQDLLRHCRSGLRLASRPAPHAFAAQPLPSRSPQTHERRRPSSCRRRCVARSARLGRIATHRAA